jgi:hypothetical protein
MEMEKLTTLATESYTELIHSMITSLIDYPELTDESFGVLDSLPTDSSFIEFMIKHSAIFPCFNLSFSKLDAGDLDIYITRSGAISLIQLNANGHYTKIKMQKKLADYPHLYYIDFR